MRVLVTVASKHGSTREIADAIAEELRAENLSVDLIEASDVKVVSGYDAVILGSAIYAGSWLPAAKHFAEAKRGELAALPVWVFSSGPLGKETPQPQDDPARLAAPLGDLRVMEHRVFVGKLDFDRLGLPERLIAKAVHAPEGDFRDWKDIRGWARGLAREIAGAAPLS